MKLFYSQTSPFVRKCLVTAHELGLAPRLELKPAAAHPVNRDRSVVERNPLGKIPTLVTDAGAVFFDSRVICEYLNGLGDGHLLPTVGEARFAILTDQALADGLMDAAVLARYESVDLLRARLHTGRTHQIRVHLASAGHPVVGDDTYGGGGARRLVALPAHRHFLHAAWLRFRHPITNAVMDLRAPLPADLRRSLAAVSGDEQATLPDDPLTDVGFYHLGSRDTSGDSSGDR